MVGWSDGRETHARDTQREFLVFRWIHPLWDSEVRMSHTEETPWMRILLQELDLLVSNLDIFFHIIEILYEQSESLGIITSLHLIDRIEILTSEVPSEPITRIGRKEKYSHTREREIKQ